MTQELDKEEMLEWVENPGVKNNPQRDSSFYKAYFLSTSGNYDDFGYALSLSGGI